MLTLEQLADLLGKSVDYFLRPTGTNTIEQSFDEEQTRALDLRQALLTAQAYLEHAADSRVSQILEKVSQGLSRLSQTDRVRYHYLLGRYYNRLGKTGEALAALQRADQVRHEPGYPNTDPELSAQVDYEMGEANLASSRVMNALNHYTHSLETVGTDSNPALRWIILARIAGCYLLLNELEMAQAYFQQSFELAEKFTRADQADYFYQQAVKLSEQGDFQRASFLFGRSLQVYELKEEHAFLQKAHLELAQLLFQAKDLAAAEQSAQRSLKLTGEAPKNDRCQEVATLVLLASVYYSQNQLENALSYLDRASALVQGKQCGEPLILGRYYQTAATLKAAQGERAAAEQDYLKAIETLSPFQNKSDRVLIKQLAEVYYNYGHHLKEWSQPGKSLDFMEKAYRLSAFNEKEN